LNGKRRPNVARSGETPGGELRAGVRDHEVFSDRPTPVGQNASYELDSGARKVLPLYGVL
jgi:hypothetical protein